MNIPDPKFIPGEPAITQSVLGDESFSGKRVIILEAAWTPNIASGEFGWGYRTIPSFCPGFLNERCLRPLPPEDLKGLLETEELSRDIEVPA